MVEITRLLMAPRVRVTHMGIRHAAAARTNWLDFRHQGTLGQKRTFLLAFGATDFRDRGDAERRAIAAICAVDAARVISARARGQKRSFLSIVRDPNTRWRGRMRKLGYIRTSTEDQLVDRQLDRLREVCDRVFIEDAVSAVRAHRPVYDDLMRELAPGDTFVVSSLDRAFRSSLDALTELERLHRQGVQFLSLSQNFDATTPDGKFLYTIAAALAAWERDILSQRTKEGLAAARRRGKVLGRPRKLTAEQITEARRMLGNSTPSVSQLAAILRVHERTLVRAMRETRA